MKHSEDVAYKSFYKILLHQLISLSSEFQSDKKHSGELTSKQDILRTYSNYAVIKNILRWCFTPEDLDELQSKGSMRPKALKNMSDALTLIELQSYIRSLSYPESADYMFDEESSKEGNLNVFGVEAKALKLKARELIKDEYVEVLKEEFRNCLTQQCNRVIYFTLSADVFSSTTEGIVAVTQHVTQLKKNSHSQSILLAKQKQYNSSLLNLVFEQLIEYGNALESLVKKGRMSSQIVAHLNFVCLSMNAYLLRLRCLHKEIMAQTYTTHSVPALKSINKDLCEREVKVSKALGQVDYKLSAFENLDPKFEDLLQEYANLKKDLILFQS